MIYAEHAELLTERALWRQPALFLARISPMMKELEDVLNAPLLDKNEKMSFECMPGEHQVAVLLDNYGAHFWIHYFRCGIGLFNSSLFGHLTSAEASLLIQTRGITHKSEFQWFAHDFGPEVFTGKTSEKLIEGLGDYFIERVNPTLVRPYSIRYENLLVKELYKFVSGSLEKFREVLMWV